jgi:hypothetical protein
MGRSLNSWEINVTATTLQYKQLIFKPVTSSSNRESQGQSRGAPGCLFHFASIPAGLASAVNYS